jgi:hypothetical protein
VYSYVENDPVNFVDPAGLIAVDEEEIVVIGRRSECDEFCRTWLSISLASQLDDETALIQIHEQQASKTDECGVEELPDGFEPEGPYMRGPDGSLHLRPGTSNQYQGGLNPFPKDLNWREFGLSLGAIAASSIVGPSTSMLVMGARTGGVGISLEAQHDENERQRQLEEAQGGCQ